MFYLPFSKTCIFLLKRFAFCVRFYATWLQVRLCLLFVTLQSHRLIFSDVLVFVSPVVFWLLWRFLKWGVSFTILLGMIPCGCTEALLMWWGSGVGNNPMQSLSCLESLSYYAPSPITKVRDLKFRYFPSFR
jgi:hypothetical protein